MGIRSVVCAASHRRRDAVIAHGCVLPLHAMVVLFLRGYDVTSTIILHMLAYLSWLDLTFMSRAVS